ncbi:hypothetical protein EVA_15755, partial [gut metagenome]
MLKSSNSTFALMALAVLLLAVA